MKKIIKICFLLLTFLIIFSPFYAINNATATDFPLLSISAESFVLRSTFSTKFSTKNIGRTHNISLCARSINKTFLDVGAQFSFNDVVGERSLERGYKNAKIIKDNAFIDGVGGGVCQVSSTLYNAALLAGLTITEVNQHSLAVSYVEPSFDAMVGYDYADLKFINSTNYPIIIYAKVLDNVITVKIYGEKLKCEIKRKSQIVATIPMPEYKKIIDEENKYLLKENEEKIISYGKDGLISQGYLVVKEDGKEKIQRIRTNTYKSIQGIIAVAPKLDVEETN